MNIYIASSWKNQHAVEMLTVRLREAGHVVWSFVENNNDEHVRRLGMASDGSPLSFDNWVWSEAGSASFVYDTDGAMKADIVVYIGPSGPDAWAEIGAAYASKRRIVGLHAKGDTIGLMRRMIPDWFDDYRKLLAAIGK